MNSNWNWKKIGVLIAAIPVLIMVCSLFVHYHDTFAEAEVVAKEDEIILAQVYKVSQQVSQVSTDLKYYSLTNQAAKIEDRMYLLKDRYKCEEKDMPQTAKEEYRRLKRDRDKLLKEAKKLEGK